MLAWIMNLGFAAGTSEDAQVTTRRGMLSAQHVRRIMRRHR